MAIEIYRNTSGICLGRRQRRLCSVRKGTGESHKIRRTALLARAHYLPRVGGISGHTEGVAHKRAGTRGHSRARRNKSSPRCAATLYSSIYQWSTHAIAIPVLEYRYGTYYGTTWHLSSARGGCGCNHLLVCGCVVGPAAH